MEKLFGYFTDLVISKSRSDARVITDSENGCVLALEISSEEGAGKEMFDVESALANASFFLGDREVPLKFHMAKAIYPKDGSTKENLLNFLGIQQGALMQFRT